MIVRINFIKIISAHFGTLKSLDNESNKTSSSDLFLFVLLPLIFSVLLSYFDIGFKPIISDIITAVSILAGFLFNLLAIIYTSLEKINVEGENSEMKKKFIIELHSNISYNILLSIFIIIFLLLYKVNLCTCNLFWNFIDKILIGINYFLLFSFLLTLLMVLNRIFILLDKRKKESN